MPTRNVVLTAHHEAVIESLVRSGRYQNASEVLREGLRLVERREAEDAARLAALQEAARLGVEAFERGDFASFDSFDTLERHLDTVTETVIAESFHTESPASSRAALGRRGDPSC